MEERQTLWLKELKASRTTFLAITVVIAAWDLFLFTQTNAWSRDLILALSLLPLAVLPFFSLIAGVTTLRREWPNRTRVLSRFLPLQGMTILSIKQIAIFLELLLGAGLIITGATLLGGTLIPPDFTPPLRVLVVVGLALSTLAFACLSQFAYIAGRLCGRFSVLAAVWVFLLSLWGIGRLATLLVPLLTGLPNLALRISDPTAADLLTPSVIQIDPAPLFALVVGFLVLFFLGAWLMEHHVQA
ncbi:MAG TPA: hypothetical protein VLH40_03430 [Atribacteraceae bacterium]|nr:hypothetical protein [Atribacteraceae bacterium]